MDLKQKKHFYNRCNPDEPLRPGDQRNVDIDSLGDSEIRLARGRNWVHALATRIELSDAPVCEFFTGLRGSGKSTELLRLADRLSRKQGAHLLPVVINAEEALDIYNPIDVPDILVVTLHAVERAVLETEGRNPDKALDEGFLARVAHWLLHTEVRLSSLQAGVKSPGGQAEAKAVLEMKTDPSFRKKVRERISEHLTTFLEHAEEETLALNERARKAGWEGIVVIFDSLDKLRGTSDNWDDVLASAEKVFTGGAPYLRLPPLHLVYTIPPALAWRLNIPVHFMPMLKLAERDPGQKGQAPQPGYQAARRLVAQRLPDEALALVFGADFEARVAELIAWSGGYPREIVRLLQICVGQAPVSAALFRRLLSQEGDNYRRTVPEEAFSLLARVRRDRRLPVDKDNRELVDLMLANNVILRYQNDEEWFDLHPALREWSEVLKAESELARGDGDER